MKKPAKIGIRTISLILVILLSPFIQIGLFATAILRSAVVVREVQHYKIRKEVFEYVEDHKESIEIESRKYSQYFEYADHGFWDAGVIYGYFYSPKEESSEYDSEYRGGWRREGSPNYGDGWVYFEKICENWYYYEEHYG